MKTLVSWDIEKRKEVLAQDISMVRSRISENEQKVIIKNQQPPSGSQGALTQTRGGFLIPDDLSEIQKDNALNIINELRAKNAFPGDTATSTDATDSNTSSD